MKTFFLILLYVIGFSFVSIFISQLPEIINNEELFKNPTEVYLSIIAGVMAGIIVGLLNIKTEEVKTDNF